MLYGAILRLSIDYPFGIGIGIAPAAYEKTGDYKGVPVEPGQVSLYGYLLLGSGYLGLGLFLLFAWIKLRKAMRAGPPGWFILPAGVALLTHHLVVTEFWWPFLWLFFSITDWAYRIERRAQKRSAVGGLLSRRYAGRLEEEPIMRGPSKRYLREAGGHVRSVVGSERIEE
jgi:hypothetical protein